MGVQTTSYLKSIEEALRFGRTTEHTHRPALKELVEGLLGGVKAINEPGRVDCGAPDFLVTRSPGPLTVGYIETKDIGKSLDEAERSEQLRRYRRSLSNLVLTDYLEFRWYVDGEHQRTARLARVGTGGKVSRHRDGEREVVGLLQDFLVHVPEPVSSPRELAERMAQLTHLIRDIIVEAFDKHKESALLRDLREAFATALIPDLDQPVKTGEFADMYAQTIGYGLFAARCNHNGPGPFQRLGAATDIPKTNPFLRTLFETVTGTDLDDEPYAPFVDDLVQLLRHADMDAILAQFGKRTRREDPVVHFYETFLATYDPKLRVRRGVYYTPDAVVSYIVRSVDHLLRTRFSLPDGLADTAIITYERDEDGRKPRKTKVSAPRVLVLDPACGTGTFLYTVVDHVRHTFAERGNAGMWSGYVNQQLLPRIFGFELLMAPYAVAHFKLGLQLAGHDMSEEERKVWAYDFTGNERLGVYLTNTLEEAERRVDTLFGPLRVITEEANAAAWVKRDMPILVVMGNPPYQGHSANRSWEVKDGKRVRTFIGQLLQDYYSVDGKPLGERNPKWLQDDYVKFLRWGQRRIDATGAGILAFITNHSYLDNPTFRGMRQHLMNSFTRIYILDLHGNYKKQERCPDGSPDKNVFDIQQGVAIGIFIKEPNKTGPAKVYHADLWGLSDSKYRTLFETDIGSTPWKELAPRSPLYLFVPQDTDLEAEYEKGWRVNEIFSVSSVGVVTARDGLTIRWAPDEVWETVQGFARIEVEQAREKYALGQDVRDWKVHLAQQDIRASGPERSRIVEILYRPFDVRFTYYTGRTRGFICMPRPQVSRHMLATKSNVALVVPRRVEIAGPWMHALATNTIVDHVAVSLKTIDSCFPLYVCSINDGKEENGQGSLPGLEATTNPAGLHSNLAPPFISTLAGRIGLSPLPYGIGDLKQTFGPEDVLHYIYAIYAILHSPTYRSRYAESLKRDFPRVPLTSDPRLFAKLCHLGKELVALHLLNSPIVSNFVTRYPVPGENRVERGYSKYLSPGEPEPGTGRPVEQGRVYINKAQYFDGVALEVWEFHVGGYQVCEKWLKDRQGRCLSSYDDLTHYQRVIVVIGNTIRLMDEIDEAIPSWPIR